MPSFTDWLVLGALVIGLPVYDYFTWPRTTRRIRASPHRGRLRAYASTIALQWLLLGAAVWSWRHSPHDGASLGLTVPAAWRLWVSVAVVLVVVLLHGNNVRAAARSESARAHLRRAIGDLDFLMPHTLDELSWFVALSLTAGVCEELLFRGYFIGVLAPAIGWWGAAALNVPIFGLLHAYQGRKGIAKTAAVGAVMTLVVALGGTLYFAMILHAAIDVGSGLMLWLALRDVPPVGATPIAA